MNKKFTTLLFSILFGLFTLASEANTSHFPFQNLNEGKSFHFYRKTFFGNWLFKKRMTKFRKELSRDKIEIISKSSNKFTFVCEEKLINLLNEVMDLSDGQFIRRKYYLYILRENNIIDDISLENYLSFSKVFPSLDLSTFTPDRFKKDREKLLKIFTLRNLNNTCFIENTSSLLGNFKYEKKKLKKFLKKSNLTKNEKNLFLKSLKKKLYQQRLSNKKYHEKLSSLRPKIESDIPLQKSDRISELNKELNTSLRINLFKKFSTFQIVLLNKVIQNFQRRVEKTNWLNIQLYDVENNIIEEIKIESPVEVYRFCIKLFRKEMSELKINHLFNGVSLNYYDFLAAAYEMRTINNDFLVELYKIKEIWSPHKSFWQKVKVWASVLSGVATIFTPPPFNYLVSFGLIAIDYYNKPEAKASYEHSIFGEIK